LKINIYVSLLLITLVSFFNPENKSPTNVGGNENYTIIVKPGFENNKISLDWIEALFTRHSKKYLDSLSGAVRPLTKEENEWIELIESRTPHWNQLKYSLKVPFGDIYINDTTYVLLGYQGGDDGFTYEFQTVCFDLTALLNAYGSANATVNTNRMDRLFAHEYTHLLSKEWARQNDLKLTSYKDSILWECIYEGIGMYRSMSNTWFPIGDSLSYASSRAFETLYPIFTDRLITIMNKKQLNSIDKKRLHQNLSRGSMTQKWGALPIGVWLAMEARGNDENLIKWIQMGYNAVIPLAKKYLSGESKIRFEKAFVKTPVIKR
jgi:hypothetical protein